MRRHDVRGALGLGGKRAKERVHIAFAREAFGFLLELRYQHRHEAYGYEDVDVFECACAEDAWRVWRIAMTYDQRYEWLDLNIRLRGRTSLVVTEGKAGIARDAAGRGLAATRPDRGRRHPLQLRAVLRVRHLLPRVQRGGCDHLDLPRGRPRGRLPRSVMKSRRVMQSRRMMKSRRVMQPRLVSGPRSGMRPC